MSDDTERPTVPQLPELRFADYADPETAQAMLEQIVNGLVIVVNALARLEDERQRSAGPKIVLASEMPQLDGRQLKLP